jgi:photosystem II stability/assembly factor-like uncharacterized protein
MTAVAKAGPGRLVAAGWRGLVAVSTDAGRTWRQAKVPVSVDLTCLSFTSPQRGWAAGADGVLLESSDGGMTWQKRGDGNLMARWMVERYQARATANPGDTAISAALNESRAYQREGPGRPFLDIAFEGEQLGYLVGAYGIAFRSGDGGATWDPIFDRIDNPNGYHLYALAQHRGEIFIAGELGTLLRLDRARDRFVKVATPYEGTFFTLVATGEALLAAGLRGNAYVSHDGGRSWDRSDFGGALPGSFSSGTVAGSKDIVLGTQSGQVFHSRDAGRRFQPVGVKAPMLYSALLVPEAGRLLTAGSRGVRVEALA